MSMPAPTVAAHIGLILHDFPAGGTERIAIRLAGHWASAGRRVTIFCGTETGPARALVGDNVSVLAMTPCIARGRGSRRRLGLAVADMIAELRPDVLVAPGNFHIPVLHALGRRLGARRPPTVCKISNPLVRGTRGRAAQIVFNLSTRFATRKIDTLIAMSVALRSEIEVTLGSRHIETIAEPILTCEVPRRPARNIGGGSLILCAGRLVAQKDFALALQAFARLADSSARLLLLGDGPQRPALELLAATLGVAPRVTFAGHVPDIAPYLAIADVFLLSSAYEGYPAVLIEALAAGVPVVTTRCSVAIDEILTHASLGEAVAAEPDALAAALCRVLAGGDLDPPARAGLSAKHQAAGCAAAWLEVLDDAVARRRA